jgi:prevent-host-death family protein
VDDIPLRELRNDVSGVLRRVESGERLRVTVSGRPVAELVPLPGKPVFLPWSQFGQGSDEWRADAGLAQELHELLPDTTDDTPLG